ncbi:MAG: NAD(P)H-dependent oxidoreductase [Nitratireductor sp.]|nr:NAD(P)H-dependent oxidoreductase [Nitratireductor sp.]
MKIPKILIVPGSNRSGSHNVRLAGTIAKHLSRLECEVARISLADYPMPIYDGDLEGQKGQPENARKLARLFHEHDGIVLVSPEYNTSLTPLMKNMIDWISRVGSDQHGKLVPYRGKIFAIASASPGGYGGIRGLNHLRAILVNVGALVLSEQLAVANAENAFDEMDELTDKRASGFLDAMARSLVEKSAAFSARG